METILALCIENESLKTTPPPKKSMSGLDAQTREDFLSPEVIFLAVGASGRGDLRSSILGLTLMELNNSKFPLTAYSRRR